MAVAFDAVAAIVNGFSVTSLTTGSFTIGAGSNRAAALLLGQFNNTSTGFTGSCGGVSAALVASTDTTTAVSKRTQIWACANPASGSQTGSMSWTTASSYASLVVMTVSGADQTTPMNNGATTSKPDADTSIAIAMTSSANDLSATCCIVGSSLTGTDQTSRGNDGNHGADTATTPAASVTHTWTYTSNSGVPMSGANFQAAGGGGTAVKDIIGMGIIPFAR